MMKTDGERLTNLVGEDLALCVANDIHSDGSFIAELLKERQQHAGITNLHAVDPLERSLLCSPILSKKPSGITL